MKKNERGITLISLVVTIVILSILASLLVDASIKNSPAIINQTCHIRTPPFIINYNYIIL